MENCFGGITRLLLFLKDHYFSGPLYTSEILSFKDNLLFLFTLYRT